MTSVILQTTARVVYPMMITFALFMFFRGHDFPGGGFIGGLLASAGILLIYIAFGVRQGDRIYGLNYRRVAFVGLICAAVAALLPMMSGRPFLASMVQRIEIPLIGVFEASTVLFFDLGVFLVVLGTIVGAVKAIVLERRYTANSAKESH